MNQHSRRDFLKHSALIGGGLFLGFDLFATKPFETAVADAALEGAFDFNAYLSINTDGTATIFSPTRRWGRASKPPSP